MPLNRGLVGLQRQFGRFGKKTFVPTRIGTWLDGLVNWWVGDMRWSVGGWVG